MKTCKFLTVAAVNLSLAVSALAQAPASSVPAAPPAATASGAKAFSTEELEQLLAPIALYPDALFTQILMASTYPLEVVAAERWVKANANLKDKGLEDALQKQPWDPSVKSLALFPQVLTMMSEKIDWTQKLGDAFLAQQKDVLATAQVLRKKAMDQGALKDSSEQKIVTETTGTTNVIRIEPTNPEVVYVPTYNPTVVYGAWPSPAYPPYSYYPPGYSAGAMFFSFAAGAIVGGALWGDCDWGRGDVNVNVNKYNNFNRSNVQNRNWSHNATHRGAVPYRDQRVAQQYGRTQAGDAAAREQFRGRADAGRSEIQRGKVAGDPAGRSTPGRADAGKGADLGGRDAGRKNDARDSGRDSGGRNTGRDSGGRDAGGRSTAGVDRGLGSQDSRGTRSTSAFDTSRGAQTRDISSRGSASLSSARSSGGLDGGGSRGGGGRGGGGGGGRR